MWNCESSVNLSVIADAKILDKLLIENPFRLVISNIDPNIILCLIARIASFLLVSIKYGVNPKPSPSKSVTNVF